MQSYFSDITFAMWQYTFNLHTRSGVAWSYDALWLSRWYVPTQPVNDNVYDI